MTSFAARLRAGDPARTCRRGLWLTFLSPFGLEVAAIGGAEWIAIDQLDDILGVDGVDGIFVGPYDLALSLGQESVLDTAVVSAIESVIDRTRRRDRITGIFAGNRELTGLL